MKNRMLLFLVAIALGLFLAGQTRAQDDTVYLPIVIRPQPTPTPSPTPIPPSNLDLTALVYEGSDEYVEIRNNGAGGQDMTGWYLVSVVGPQTYYFPAMIISPGQTVRIHSGPAAFDAPPAHLFWTSAFIWNNTGDKAELRTSSGNLVDSRCYGNGCP